MGLFGRKKTEEEKQVEAEAGATEAAEKEREGIERKAAYNTRYGEVRKEEAVKKAEVQARRDAATVGQTPGMKIIHGVAGAIKTAQKVAGGGAQPSSTVVRTEETRDGKKIVTERHYAPQARGRTVIPAFEMPGAGARRAAPKAAPKTRTILVDKGGGVYEERKVPVPAAAAPPKRAPAGYTFPGLEGNAGLGGVGASAALRVGAPAKKRKGTGIPMLDNPW